jgi:hypothetical protein
MVGEATNEETSITVMPERRLYMGAWAFRTFSGFRKQV